MPSAWIWTPTTPNPSTNSAPIDGDARFGRLRALATGDILQQPQPQQQQSLYSSTPLSTTAASPASAAVPTSPAISSRVKGAFLCPDWLPSHLKNDWEDYNKSSSAKREEICAFTEHK